eukprot:1178382-Prorocentrum_minimum.AAC.1
MLGWKTLETLRWLAHQPASFTHVLLVPDTVYLNPAKVLWALAQRHPSRIAQSLAQDGSSVVRPYDHTPLMCATLAVSNPTSNPNK